MKLIKIARRPRSPFSSRHGIRARKGNIQHIFSVVACAGAGARAHAFAVAGGSEGEGDFADGGAVAVVAVRVAPDAVELACVSLRSLKG